MRLNCISCVGIALIICGSWVPIGCSKGSYPESLIEAAENGNALACEQLIRNGVPVDVSISNGETALDWAVYGHNVDVVKSLIKMGADVNHQDARHNTPLMYTATPFRGRKTSDHDTMAVRNQIAQLLLQHGADVNHVGEGGNTVLHFAASNQNAQLVRMLLEAGANKNIKTDQGYTALDIARFPDYKPNTDVIDLLKD